MRLMIDGGGYATAATAFAEANAVAAMQHDALVGALSAYAGMAGHDPVGAEFAGAYDEAAREALAGYADLVTALATLGHLTEASLARHDEAERAAIIPGAVVYEGAALTPGTYASVLRATPPSALGGDGTTLAPAQEWVLDQLEGIFWPSADTARLRAAAQTWRGAAEGLALLTGYVDTATRGLEHQLSPEVPLALDAYADVRAGVDDLTAQYAALGDACDAFAANVEARRDELLDLLGELLEILVEGAACSLAVGLLSAGTAAGATGAATAAKIAARYPRFAAVIALFRSVATSTATTLRAVREALALRRARFVRYLTSRVALRGERGAVDFSAYFSRGYLRRHEAPGHVLRDHVGKSPVELAARFTTRRPPPFASTFDDEIHAERVVRTVLERHANDIDKWLSSRRHKLAINAQLDFRTGISMSPAGEILHVTRARVVMIKDPTMREGWRILTAFPQP